MPSKSTRKGGTNSTTDVPVKVAEDFWAPIQADLDRAVKAPALEGRPFQLSHTDHARIYTSIYNLLDPRPPYEQLSAYSFSLANDMLDQVQQHARDDADFLKMYLRVFEGYLTVAVVLSRLFARLDRDWIKREWDLPGAPGTTPTQPDLRPIEVPGMISDVLTLDNDKARVDQRDIDREGDLRALVWPLYGQLEETNDAIKKSHQKAAFEAREYALLPVTLPVPVQPTVLRMWRLVSAKRFGQPGTASESVLLDAIQCLANDADSEKRITDGRRFARCCWATGVLLDDPLFVAVKDALRGT